MTTRIIPKMGKYHFAHCRSISCKCPLNFLSTAPSHIFIKEERQHSASMRHFPQQWLFQL